MVVYDGDMQKWVWRYFLVIILSAWITFTLLMIQSGTAITTTASEAAANVPLYQAPPPTTLRLSGTTSDLTIPSFRFLATGNIWSYVSKQRSIDPDFTPPLTDELATSSNIGQGLQGLVPNLNISMGSGRPGTGTGFNIRGFTSINGGSPLVLVDGVQMDPNQINPNSFWMSTISSANISCHSG